MTGVFMSLIMHRLNGLTKKSIHAQACRRHNTKFTRHFTSHQKKNSHLLRMVPYYYVIICKYEAISITYVCVLFVLISRNENKAYFFCPKVCYVTLLC